MDTIIKDLLLQAGSPELRDYVTQLLLDVCRIDTTPYADVKVMRDAESAVFDIIEKELEGFSFAGARMERRKINPAISEHPAYSQLHFTKTDECPGGLSPETVYAERSNLLYFIPGADGGEGPDGVAVNGHIDVVKPYIPPRLDEQAGIIYGRGACDDKGPVIALVAALKILQKVLADHQAKLKRNLVGMIVVEEETGGNGSLSLALDKELKKLYDSILILECTGNDIHPANRGAVWYKAELQHESANLFEMSAFAIEQMEYEGRAIKAESRHALFPQRPVQTCHGMIGHYGEHPSRICGEVAFRIDLDGEVDENVTALIQDVINSALAEYIAVYGDKTKAIDQTTGKPKVDHHYDLLADARGFCCQVYGSTGHMGSILENDGAITKMASFVRALVRSKAKIAAMTNGTVQLSLFGEEAGTSLVLEGGQGFVPRHGIEEVMERVADAAAQGAQNYLRLVGLAGGAEVVKVNYEKLHNAAFDGDPNSSSMCNAVAAAKLSGMWNEQEIMGWTVSCDARLFAGEYPEMNVVTSGAGLLQYAHGDAEQLKIDDLMLSVGFIAVYLLKEAGLA